MARGHILGVGSGRLLHLRRAFIESVIRLGSESVDSRAGTSAAAAADAAAAGSPNEHVSL
jgi:hypothetical protein